MTELVQHNAEIMENLSYWEKKPLLRKIYQGFHRIIGAEVDRSVKGEIVELGSGIGNIKEVIPECVRTDLFTNPWLDRLENAYKLSVKDGTISNLILFDVFHHLRYPGTALDEARRALAPGGKVIIFDPCISLLGSFVYGVGHHEPVGLFEKIEWRAPQSWTVDKDSYYAAQGNVTRIFSNFPLGKVHCDLTGWKVKKISRFAALSYVLSGGYRGAQLYPECSYPLLMALDKVLNLLPWIFATRILVVLEKE